MTHARATDRPTALRPRQSLAWIAGALALVGCVELLAATLAPDASERHNFFEYRYGHDEAPERVLVDTKLALFSASDATLLQVGDSSGFHGVTPPIVEAVLPGARFVNLSVFANLGYRGYYEMARAALRGSPNVKVLVLYVTPAGFQPNAAMVSAKDLLGEDIWRAFGSSLHALFHWPSLALRRTVTSHVYDGHVRSLDDRDRRALRRYPEAKQLIAATGGWTREHDTPDDRAPGARATLRTIGALPASMPDAEVLARVSAPYGKIPEVFDLKRLRSVSLADPVFDAFRELADSHGAQLVIAAAPMSDVFRDGATGARLAQFQATLEAYQAAHPEVGLVPMIYWPDERFSSPVHVATPFTRANTLRFAQALKAAIGARDVAAPHPARRPTRDALSADALAGYGLSPVVASARTPYRTLREGRSDALLFAQIRRDATVVALDLAEDTPEDIVSALTLSLFDEPAARLSDTVREGVRRVIWRLPDMAFCYDGWVELQLSTQGAAGAQLKIVGLRFTPDP